MALWNNAGKRAQIQAALDTGEIELFGMTYEPTYPTTEGYELWFDYALTNNSDTIFFVGLPWLDFPRNYSDEDYINIWMAARDTLWQDFIGRKPEPQRTIPAHRIVRTDEAGATALRPGTERWLSASSEDPQTRVAGRELR